MEESKVTVAPNSGINLLDYANIPTLLLGPAGTAISRLVGATTDIPVAYLERVAGGIRSKTENRKLVDAAIGSKVGSLAASDPQITQRALENLVRKEYRCQENKDAVARLTLERLSNATPQLKEMADNEEKGSDHNVDDDWLNTFERYAEDASSDRMRNLWAKVLSGEIRKPRSYSLRTIRFLSELEAETASTFENISAEIVSNSFIPSTRGPVSGKKIRHNFNVTKCGVNIWLWSANCYSINGQNRRSFSHNQPRQDMCCLWPS